MSCAECQEQLQAGNWTGKVLRNLRFIEDTVNPTTAPIAIGIIYLNTITGKTYISKGIANVSDWVALN